MSSRLTQFALALSLLLNCFVLAGFVYRSWIAPPHWHGRMGAHPGSSGARPVSPIEALSQDLELDNAQKEGLKGLFEQYRTARRDRFREIQKVREAMSAELQKPEFDMTKMEPLVEQMARLRAEQQKDNLRAVSELASHLRPEQREEMHTILAERYGGGWRGRRGPPRPPE